MTGRCFKMLFVIFLTSLWRSLSDSKAHNGGLFNPPESSPITSTMSAKVGHKTDKKNGGGSFTSPMLVLALIVKD